MKASYLKPNKFSIDGNVSSEFVSNRRLKLDCGSDGIFYSSVDSSEYTYGTTKVFIKDDYLTSNLKDVLFGAVSSDTKGSLPDHYHTDLQGDGGQIDIVTSLLDLDDTFTTYSGTEGNYLRVTNSGVEAVDGIILEAPNGSEWLLQVTNSGTLYTTSYS